MRCYLSLGILVALFGVTLLSAEQGRIIRTVDLNADCVADTLYGSGDAIHEVPTHIVWGRRHQTSTCDSSYYEVLPHQQWLPRTEIMFEGFTAESCSIRSMLLNGDGFRDVLFVVRGYRHVRDVDGTLRREWHRLRIAVPAQRGLDTLSKIVFRSDSGIVLSPFPHVYLIHGVHVGTIQDIQRSGISAQAIPLLRLPVNARSDMNRKESVIPRPMSSVGRLAIRAVPNPAESDEVSIECSRDLAVAILEVYSLHGELLHRTSGTRQSASATLRLGTAGLNSGTYLVRVIGDDASSASTILVVRR